jgi:hypothetical protein
MLDDTKVQETDSFKCIAECLVNLESELVSTRDTFTALDARGYGYFMGNIIHRGRYENLADPFMIFVKMVITYTRQNFPSFTNKLEQNKDRFKQYLKQNNWTTADMFDHEWRKD